MFEVKVKTLDGRTHEFSVPDNATVMEFKEIIREKMDITVDRQRLLYQGRVLQDENVLSSYDVAGNVMHLVTRMPPQAPRPANEVTIEREENSDINRDQIRNILSDVFTNISDLNNPMGSVSVNNEGSRMDITVNIPTQNRLSLSRLRQNYVMRLLDQARNVVRHMEDPSSTAPRLDRERLRQADPYDIGPNDERLTEVTSQPLPISNLADMISHTRSLWRDAEPQLQLWESVLRRENTESGVPRVESEMQRMHDSASRYVHLFSHALHILSDYLVEFQQGTAVRPAASATTTATTQASAAADAATSVSIDEINVPLTGAFGESGMAHSDANETTTTTTATPAEAAAEISDRSRYLYVFSEMPAQLVQVRLDVDSNIPNLRSTTNAQSTAPQPQATMQPPRPTESTRQAESTIDPVASATATVAGAANETPDARTRSRRRFQTNGNTMENLFRTTLQDTLMGPNMRPTMAGGSRTIRSSPQFMENVDPYVRCQSRHFQHPSNLRSGAVISTISGIRLRESSRTRQRAPDATPTSTANSTTTPMTNVRSQSNDADPMRSLISGLMNSIFPSAGEAPRSTTSEQATSTAPTSTASTPLALPNEIQRMIQAMTSAGGSNMHQPLSQVFPEMLSNQDLDPDNRVTNQIVQIVISRLTLMDFLGIVRGQYSPLNQLRLPLQELLARHQREAGSRDSLVNHVVADLEFFNRAYIDVFERLRSGAPVEELSEEARRSFNIRVDIFRTINNLNRHHFQSMIDMIMRSPTNQGFGQLLMTSLTSHHDESLALIDIVCNNNDELRRFLIKSFMDSLLSSMNSDNSGTGQTMNSLGLDMLLGGVDSGLFRRPEQLAQLKEHAINHFVVYFAENGIGAASDSVDSSVGNGDSIEDMVTNLSEEIISGASLCELAARPLASGPEAMDACVREGGNLPAEWLAVVQRDSEQAAAQTVPYSDAYVSGMPPKRRKVIVSGRQRAVQPALEMMADCLEGAVAGGGLPVATGAFPSGLGPAFQDMVAERVGVRLAAEGRRLHGDRLGPGTEEHFGGTIVRETRPEDGRGNH